MLVDLLFNKHVVFDAYADRYGMDYRSFQRDLQHLRQIGASSGFTISSIKDRRRADLVPLDRRKPAIDVGKAADAVIAELASALGGAFSSELSAAAGTSEEGFLRFVTPRLVEGSKAAGVYRALKNAWEAKPGPSIVEFTYEAGKGPSTIRRVEPYRVLLRSGRDYLLGYDLGKRAWRVFALDAIVSMPRRCGTIQTHRAIPSHLDSRDVIGFFGSSARPVDVSVDVTANVSLSVVSREWQREQRVERRRGGGARITFRVVDLGEVVRWTLGLGVDAKIVAPPEAVAAARAIVAELAANYRE